MRAKDAMTSPAVTVAPETHCKDAAGLMVRHRISALPVVDAGGRLVGLVSEADLLSPEATPDPRSQATPIPPRTMPPPRRVDEVMTPEVYTVDEDTDLGVVAQRMLDARVKRFPVMRGDQVIGVVSRHDLVKVIARTDGEVRAGVIQTLLEEGMHLTSLEIRVREGVVELTGGGDGQTLRLAGILARSVPGVLDVRVIPGREQAAGRSGSQRVAGR